MTSSGLLFCLEKSGSLSARGENRKVASTNVPLSCENPRKRGEEIQVEMEDFHNVGFRLGGNLKLLKKVTYFSYGQSEECQLPFMWLLKN